MFIVLVYGISLGLMMDGMSLSSVVLLLIFADFACMDKGENTILE